MKNIPVLSFLFVAAASFAPAAQVPSFADAEAELRAEADPLVPFGELRRAQVGMTRDQVRAAMQGRPDVLLGQDVWVYWGMPVKGQSEDSKNTTLLVVFAHDRVKQIRLVEPESVRKLVAQLDAHQRKPKAVASK